MALNGQKTGLENVRSERKADVDYADPQCRLMTQTGLAFRSWSGRRQVVDAFYAGSVHKKMQKKSQWQSFFSDCRFTRH